MKLTTEQEQFVEQTLRKALNFKDTYNEVYDHILSAFDALPDDIDFADALHNIIAYDFGGAKGLKTIERKHTRFAIYQFITDYLKDLLKPLTSITILFLMAGTRLFYFLIASGWLDRYYMLIVVLFIPLPALSIAVFKFRQQAKALQAGQQLVMNYIRQTIIAFSGGFMLFFPMFLWATVNTIYHKLKYDQVPLSVCTIVFFVAALHTFAGYKMYTTPVITLS